MPEKHRQWGDKLLHQLAAVSLAGIGRSLLCLHEGI